MAEMETLLGKGVLPLYHDQDTVKNGGEVQGMTTPEDFIEARPMLMGQAAGAVKGVQSAAEIMNDMVNLCCDVMDKNHGRISSL